MTLSLDELLQRLIAGSQADGTFVVLARTRTLRIDLGPRFPRLASESSDTALSLTVMQGRRYGTISAHGITASDLPALQARALDQATLMPEFPSVTPFPAPVSLRPSAIHDPALVELTPQAALDLAARITAPVRAANTVLRGTLTVQEWDYAIGASTGLVLRHPHTVIQAEARILSPDGNGAGYLRHVRHRLDEGALFTDLDSAIDRARQWEKPTDIPVKRMTAVFSAQAMADMLFLMLQQFDRAAIHENRSFLRKLDGTSRLSQKMFEPWVNFRSDPYDALAPSLPFTLQGFPLSSTSWIRNGVIESITVDAASASQDGSSVQPFPSNLLVEGRSATEARLVEGMERGVTVAGLAGLQLLDPTACRLIGSTRGGTFLVENGKPKKSLYNLVLEETPIYLFELMEEVGAPELVHPSGTVFPMRVPPMRVKDVLFTRHTGLV